MAKTTRFRVLCCASFWIFLVTTQVFGQSGEWTTKAPMLAPSGFGAGAVVGDKLYVLGGFGPSSGPPLSTVESYDPKTDSWAKRAAMPTPRNSMGAASLNGILYVVGGSTDKGAFAPYLDAYNPKTNSWTSKSSMPLGRYALAVAVADGKLYAMGGIIRDYLTTDPTTAVVEAYDPATNTWAGKAPMPTRRQGFAAASVDGIIYVFGGVNVVHGFLAGVEAYNPNTDTWGEKAPMPAPREGFAVAVVDGIIYAIGGDDGHGNFLSTVESYDPKTNSWKSEPPMPTPRKAMVADTIGGTIYVAGGFVVDSKGQSVWLGTNEAFSPYLPVTIRVNPASINLKSNAKIKVAILSSSMFDATSINPDTVKLSGALAETERNGTPVFSFDDVNDDGILDLVVAFRARNLQLTKADKQVVLKGATFAGQLVKGVAPVRIVP